VQPGSLFPALHRLEESGALTSAWQPSENNRRAKFYELTKAGRKRLGDETANWQRVALAIAHALET
jgi:DNA-binding PadR family transcriptional regulator